MSLVDSHCHLNFEPMGDDIPAVLERAKAANVDYMLCVSVNLEDYPEVLAIAQAHKNIFASVGVHPCYQDVKEPTVEELLSLAQDENVVAIGETGLDYFRVEGDMVWQQARFVRHIEVGIEVGKPLIIHTREAAEDTMRILQEHHADRCGAVMHCFAEDWETAKKALDLGFYISFSGIVTFNSAKQMAAIEQAVAQCPGPVFPTGTVIEGGDKQQHSCDPTLILTAGLKPFIFVQRIEQPQTEPLRLNMVDPVLQSLHISCLYVQLTRVEGAGRGIDPQIILSAGIDFSGCQPCTELKKIVQPGEVVQGNDREFIWITLENSGLAIPVHGSGATDGFPGMYSLLVIGIHTIPSAVNRTYPVTTGQAEIPGHDGPGEQLKEVC